MTRPAAHALWRAAPRRLGRTPGWLALVLVAATLLVASVVAPPLFVATARSTALTTGLVAGAGEPYGPESGDLRVIWDSVLAPDAEAGVLERLSGLTAYGEPRVGASGVAQSRSRRAVAVAGGNTRPSVLWYHDGVIEALGGDPDADGVWLADDVADALGVAAGDPVRVGLVQTVFGTGTLTRTVVAGTYEHAPGSTLPEQVADLPDADRWFVPSDPDSPGAGAPLAVAGRATFDALVPAVGESPLYTADLLLDAGVTPDEASTAVDEVAALGVDAYDQSTRLSNQLATGEPLAAQLDIATGLPDLAAAANRTATSARDQVRPYAVGGQVLAALLLAASWVLLGLSRRREQLLASGLGVRPAELAGLAALEVLPVCVLAVPAGVALAGAGLLAAGPPTPAGLAVGLPDVVRAAAAALGGLLLVAATAGATAVGTDRLDRLSRLGRGRRPVPWGTALLAATAVVVVGVVTVDVGDRSSTPLTMLLPLLVAASVAMLVARTAARIRARRPGRARPGTPRWLATRRTGPVVREVTALTAVVALALGLFAYALTVHRGIEQGVADKTAALAGASTTIEVADDFHGGGLARAVTPPVDGTTVVWDRGVAMPPAFGDGPLLAIDTRTFAEVADWGGSGDLDAGRALLPELDRKARGVPVLLAGDTDLAVGDEATVDFSSEFYVPVQVVGVVDAFPGSEAETGTVTVVASARKLFPVLLPTVRPTRKGADSGEAGAFTSTVWSGSSAAALRAALHEEDVATDGTVETATSARIGNGLVASTWAAAYVLALGAVVLALALAAGLVLVLRLADRDTVSDVVLRRMGYAPRDLARARAWEVGYAVATAVLAALLAVALLVLAPTAIDAAAAISPLTRPRPGVGDLLALLGVLVVLVLLAWLAGTALARRRSAAEVLRAGG